MNEAQAQTIGQLNGPWVRAFKIAPLIGGASLSACVAACIWIATVMRDIDRRAESNSGRIAAIEQNRPTQADITALRAEISGLRERIARIPDRLIDGDTLRREIEEVKATISGMGAKQDAILEAVHGMQVEVRMMRDQRPP